MPTVVDMVVTAGVVVAKVAVDSTVVVGAVADMVVTAGVVVAEVVVDSSVVVGAVVAITKEIIWRISFLALSLFSIEGHCPSSPPSSILTLVRR